MQLVDMGSNRTAQALDLRIRSLIKATCDQIISFFQLLPFFKSWPKRRASHQIFELLSNGELFDKWVLHLFNFKHGPELLCPRYLLDLLYTSTLFCHFL